MFIGGDTVWKLKKAVRLGFLDFSTIAQRRRFLLRELEVNRRTAPALYRDVVAVVRRPDGALALDEDGAPVDWVLRMARVPAADFFERLVLDDALTPALLDRTADAVAAFHAGLAPALPEAATHLAEVADGNAQAALQAGLSQDTVQSWRRAVGSALAHSADWQAARQRDGFVRRAHGDLHLGNLCLWQGVPTLFDALEFDEAMATTDLGYDLAFLLMDLLARIGRPAANRVLNRYVARTGDAGLVAGLPAFLSLRAMVRAHVEAVGGKPEAGRYLELAIRTLDPAPPRLLAIGGLQGTGKSTLARALAPDLGRAPGALVLRSDEIRKRLSGVAPENRLPPAAYTPAANASVNAALLDAAERAVAGGQAVIADATWLDAAQRAAIERAAPARFVGIWLAAPLPVLEARVAARRDDASDATLDVLRQSAAAHPHPPGGAWLTVDATDPDRALAAIRTALHATPAP